MESSFPTNLIDNCSKSSVLGSLLSSGNIPAALPKILIFLGSISFTFKPIDSRNNLSIS